MSALRNDSTQMRTHAAARAAEDLLLLEEEFAIEEAEELAIEAIVDPFDLVSAPFSSSRRLIKAVMPAFLTLASAGMSTTATSAEFERAWRLKPGRYVQAAERNDRSVLLSGSFGISAPVTIADQVVLELEKLSDDWAGPGTVAPSARLVKEVASVLNALPSKTRTPSIEVEEEDGSVSIRWVAPDKARSFSLVFRGLGRVTGVLVTLNPPRSTPWSANTSDEIQLAANFEEASVREVIAS